MAKRSLRSRLSSRSHGKTMIEVVDTGISYEGCRAVWFAKSNQTAKSEDCLGRQRRLERLLDEITQEQQQ